MWIAPLLVLALAAQPLAAAAPNAPPAGVQPVGEITDPIWTAMPAARALMSAYPDAAQRYEKIGVAVVRCTAKADGALEACQLVCEQPAGWGFGAAAVRLSYLYQLKPTLADGRSVAGGTVTVPFHFNPRDFIPLARCDGR